MEEKISKKFEEENHPRWLKMLIEKLREEGVDI